MLNTKKMTVYYIGNPGSGLGQAYKCGVVKLVNGIPTTPTDNWISNDDYSIVTPFISPQRSISKSTLITYRHVSFYRLVPESQL
jgi:hypothetical protein